MGTDRDTEERPPCEDGAGGGVGTGVMLSEAKRGEETPSPGGNVALLHYDLGLSAFRTVRQFVSSVESTPPVCDNFFGGPR